jgi:hypothetical protein
MLRKVRSYTTEFKNEAIGQTAKDLGIPVSTLHVLSLIIEKKQGHKYLATLRAIII